MDGLEIQENAQGSAEATELVVTAPGGTGLADRRRRRGW